MSITRIAPPALVNIRSAWDNSTHSITSGVGIVDWGPSVSFTKVADDSLLLIALRQSGWHSVATGFGTWFLEIDSVDYIIGSRKYTTANDHASQSADSVIGGIPAGTYTCQLRAANNTSGNLQSDANDTQSFSIMEAGSQSPTGALPRLRGIVAHAIMGTVNVTSTSYVNTTLNKSFTKQYEDTRLVVQVVGGGFNLGMAVYFALQIDGTDYQVTRRWSNTSGQHKTHVGVREITGIGAGTYTVTLRVKVSGGTWSYNSGDSFSFQVLESP